MHLQNVVKAAMVLATMGVSAASAQRPTDPLTEVTRFDVSLGYQYIDANAPPGGCKCFGLNGGNIAAGLHLNQWLAVEGEVTGTHADDISTLGQNLTLLTYMVGPRVSMQHRRIVPFGQALFGSAHASDSYFPNGTGFTTTASSFALSAGGGVDVNLTPRFAIRAIEAQYLHTSFPNNGNNTQSHLMLGAGIVVKFRGRDKDKTPVVEEVPNKVNDLSCSVKSAEVKEGQVLEVAGRVTTVYPKGDAVFSWTTSGGTVQGSGRRITINTSAVAEGDYVVTGHATLAGSSESGSDCEVPFHVIGRPLPPVVAAAPPPPPPPPPDPDAAERAFHENVPDALFDYDKWAIRPDAQAAINKAAAYLAAHPGLRVLIGGFSDERGTTEYNIALGLKRANATRDALIAAGIAADRMQVVSYGKGAQVCTALNEACFQQNRRAAFSIHP